MSKIEKQLSKAPHKEPSQTLFKKRGKSYVAEPSPELESGKKNDKPYDKARSEYKKSTPGAKNKLNEDLEQIELCSDFVVDPFAKSKLASEVKT